MPIGSINDNESGSSCRTKINAALNKCDDHLDAEIYRAKISQSGISNPTVTVLVNTLGGTLVWTRSSQGLYLGTLAGAFAGEVFIQCTAGQVPAVVIAGKQSTDVVAIGTYDDAFAVQDNLLNDCSLVILSHP